jgi:hypothetical protein
MQLVRTWLVVLLAACQSAAAPSYAPRGGPVPDAPPPGPPHTTGQLEDRRIDFQFEGGFLEFELYRSGARIEQVVRNRYAVPVMIRWALGALDNVEPVSPIEGTALLPAADAPLGSGEVVVLAELQQIDPAASCTSTPGSATPRRGRRGTCTRCPTRTA